MTNHNKKSKKGQTQTTVKLHSYLQYLMNSEDVQIDALAADLAYIAIEAMDNTPNDHVFVRCPADLETKKEICARKILIFRDLMSSLENIIADTIPSMNETMDIKAMVKLLIHWTEQCFPALLESVSTGALKLYDVDFVLMLENIMQYLDRYLFDSETSSMAVQEFERLGVNGGVYFPIFFLMTAISKAIKFVMPEERELIMQIYGVDMNQIAPAIYSKEFISDFAQSALSAPVVTKIKPIL